MTLDMPTMALMLVVGFGLLTVLLELAGRGGMRRDALRRLGWSAPALCAGFGSLALRPWVPAGLALGVGHLMLLAGLGWLGSAVSWHVRQRGLPAWHRLLLGVAAVAALAALQMPAAPAAVLVSGVMAALLVPAVVWALQGCRSGERSFRVVGAMLLLACVALAGRVAYVWSWPAGEASTDQALWSSGLFMLAYMAVMAAGFSFVLAGFERMAHQMQELASVDSLTGACNHNTTVSLLAHTLERGRRESQPVSFVMLDLDHFKRVNDEHGHAVGDLVLREVAATVRGRLRSSDVFGRLGGEEFGIVLPATGMAGARRVAEQVRLAVEALPLKGDGGRPLHVTLSAGVAEASAGDTADTLMSLADKALYQAKQQGRNRIAIADDWMRQSTLQGVLK